jgi:O-antigen/teichoic acid export membrane protein
MTGITVTSIILTQLDKIFLSKFLPLEMFGYYTLAVSIAGVLSFAATSVFPAIFPVYSQLCVADEVNALATFYHKSCQLLSIMLFPLGLVMMMFSSELLSCYVMNPVIVNNTYRLLSLIIVGTMLNSIMVLPLALQLAHGWTKLSFYKNIIAIIFVVPLLIYIVTHYGAIGAAVVWILLNAGYVLIEVPIMHSRLLTGEKWKWYTMDIGCPLCISLLVVGLARFFLPSGGSPFLKLPWLVLAAFFAMAVSASILPASREWMRKAIYGRVLPIL